MPIETALEEHKTLLRKLGTLEYDVKSALEREAILKGRIEQLEMQLVEATARAEHYLRWCSEITQQMQNINMFVGDAMRLARIEVEKAANQKRDLNLNMEQLESQMKGEGNGPIQHEGKR